MLSMSKHSPCARQLSAPRIAILMCTACKIGSIFSDALAFGFKPLRPMHGSQHKSGLSIIHQSRRQNLFFFLRSICCRCFCVSSVLPPHVYCKMLLGNLPTLLNTTYIADRASLPISSRETTSRSSSTSKGSCPLGDRWYPPTFLPVGSCGAYRSDPSSVLECCRCLSAGYFEIIPALHFIAWS